MAVMVMVVAAAVVAAGVVAAKVVMAVVVVIGKLSSFIQRNDKLQWLEVKVPVLNIVL
jgi:hypothetical protein